MMHTDHSLMSYDTAEHIRPATRAEYEASKAAAKSDGGAGVIIVEIDGEDVSCYVDGIDEYTLIDSIHEAGQINKGTWFAHANCGQHYLIADSLATLQLAAEYAREDGHTVDSRAHVSLTDSDEQDQMSEQRGAL